ncbi:hypothetical protein SpiGrapes_1540 [Sphaerochaeta pleomorpha str. Grapes]|uniref:Uncharacterized protein n=1 Tax=Sphaerochaeta pleomorpha (strain ATCC BAA-1885 / DSM 22778 / Grapes) TaxID=158190 RepID=G8QVQ8_SPHPG|nr:hypothetical protein [Sphaerochaeta pleomorpha]AEV29350.1 hypothetical protein SpiGrapes_1540 [Sphaerochaeta pleomorpha str. Grapes]
MEGTETKQETKAGEKKETSKITKPKAAMLIMAAAAMVCIMAFSCYGCSYQPINPPDAQEAQDSFKKLYATSWQLDTAGITTNLEEFNDMELSAIAFGNSKNEDGFVSTILEFADIPPLTAQLGFKEDYGFYLRTNGEDIPVKVTYAQSKDGKTETVTLMGEQSNIYCYYLKK